MRIAVLGSSITPIPPVGQSSVETLAYQQVLGFAKQGHEVTLYAQAGSTIPNGRVKVVEIGSSDDAAVSSSSLSPEEIYGAAYKGRLRFSRLVSLLQQLHSHQEEYDVVLNNLCEESPVLATQLSLNISIYHILHVPILPANAKIYKERDTKLISISNAQRRAFPDLHYVSTVYNGVDTSVFTYSDKPNMEKYVLYLGSIGKNKNPKDAILAAKAAGVKLFIGGKLKDRAYYEAEIAPLIDGKQIQWVGELNVSKVVELYQGASAFLFPTIWEEPFGLVAIEALSCGTPVIAYPHGGLPEIVTNKVNGYLVNTVDEMVGRIKEIERINRKDCRKSVEEKFSIEKMNDAYLALLQQSPRS